MMNVLTNAVTMTITVRDKTDTTAMLSAPTSVAIADRRGVSRGSRSE
jgi:hypothetical protein